LFHFHWPILGVPGLVGKLWVTPFKDNLDFENVASIGWVIQLQVFEKCGWEVQLITSLLHFFYPIIGIMEWNKYVCRLKVKKNAAILAPVLCESKRNSFKLCVMNSCGRILVIPVIYHWLSIMYIGIKYTYTSVAYHRYVLNINYCNLRNIRRGHFFFPKLANFWCADTCNSNLRISLWVFIRWT